ncbi:MAG: alpha/beta hydrolase fold domain-containing protein [Rhodococcus sp. (in: high G+C Gram-positive bacteria)]|nr:alpha/beta hydrolase fold domain-containing protein [Rhodococcus sp. (in: high G+C Gram-positive bacteria)]
MSWGARWEIARARIARNRAFYADPGVMRRQLADHQSADRAQPPRSLAAALDIDAATVEGHSLFTLTPRRGVSSDLHIVHFHGGGFVEAPETHHWEFARRIVERLGCRYSLPMYPLAPEHDHRIIVPTAIEMYHRAVDTAPGGDRVLFGDSAGGSLALTIAQHLRDTGGREPACIALFSPWLNLATDDPMSGRIEPCDPELGIAGLQQAARWYAADRALDDPYLSPTHADLSALPPMTLFVGTRDLLLADVAAFRGDARISGIDLDLHIYRGMFHNWIMKDIPEAATATAELLAFVGRHTEGRTLS